MKEQMRSDAEMAAVTNPGRLEMIYKKMEQKYLVRKAPVLIKNKPKQKPALWEKKQQQVNTQQHCV